MSASGIAGDEIARAALDSRARSRPPRVRERLIARDDLVGQFGFAEYPVSMACAPAGYGKTTLAADWARRAEVDGRVAWLTLNGGHNEPFRFWSAAIWALASVTESDVAEVLLRLRPPQQGSESGFVSALVDVIDTISEPRWLVLDDVHCLRSRVVLSDLDDLLTSGTENLRFILIGRSDPTSSSARLRVAGDLCELQAAELAFSLAESRALLALHDVAVADADLAELYRRTEGWAAGLRLAALSLSGARDRHAAVTSFAGDQRPVGDYLFAEVLRQQPDDLRDFLLATCVPEKLNAALAQHLSGRVDAGAILDRLCRANALVVQLGDQSWFRYHSMLREYLAAELTRQDPSLVAKQHADAARWFAERARYRTALGHAVSCGDPEQVVRVVAEGGLNLVLSGNADAVLRAVASVPRAVDDPAVVAIAAVAALDVGELARADKYITRSNGRDPGDGLLARLVQSARLQRALLGGDVLEAIAATGVTEWERTENSDLDLLVLACRGPARLRAGDYGGAVEDLVMALDLARSAGYDEMALTALSQLSGATAAACDFAGMKRWSDEAIAFARPRGWAHSPRLAYAYLIAAWTGFQTGDVDAQTTYAERAVECLDAVTNVEVALGVRSMAALARFEASTESGRYESAREFRELWRGPAADQVSPALIGFATPQEVRLALSVGEYAWAAEAVERVERQLPHSAENLTLRATVLAARDRPTDALRTLGPVLRGDVLVHVQTTVVSAQILAWKLHARAGDAFRAYGSLERALAWAAPRDFRRPFLECADELRDALAGNLGRFGRADDFATDLLALVTQDNDNRTPVALPTPMLSARELEVLGDLPSQLNAAQIAATRMISLNTVKTHLAAIYRKLGVPGRREAVREARRLGLL